MRRLDSVHLSMLLIGVSFACYSPSLNSLQDQAYRSAVVIEGKVQSAPQNVSAELYSVNVKVLDVWPRNSGGLEREQLVTVGEFGSEAPCAKVKKNHKYIFFMDPTDEPLVFKASFAPLDTSGKNLKKDVGRILCEDCAAPPSLKRMKNPVLVDEGSRLIVRCEASGNPTPQYKWYKDGTELKKSKSKEIKISKNGKKTSKVQISSAKLEDSGNYTCMAENSLGKDNGTSTVHVQSITTTLSPGSGHARRCNESEKAYCVNGGDCYYIHGINRLSCKCPDGYFGQRCLQTEPLKLYMPKPNKKAEELYQKRVLTITGICVALLVVGIVCVVAYCKTNLPPRKQRKKMHNHLRQNIYVDHPNRNLANGPNHPGPGPEEIPMVDYISKNVPATERVIRHGAEAPFPGSRQSSRSHNSSTRAHSSSHRHEGRTWSLERTDSVLSDCPSGMMSSSVGTSKCNSPACMEARARRAAHCGFTEPHRPALQYGDSFDSLGDSPHSDRYVSALTTPARLSPVDFHYSLPPQVPTFQITSPNASHALSLPPAAHTPYPPEEDQPLLRRYQVPLHEARGHEPYRQQQRGSYLRDSTGSLPSSPYRLTQEEEYESTQEYLSSMEQPKRSSRSWRRSRLNGHVAPRGYQPSRDLGSRSCLSDSDSEEEEGESTPFLSMQNMNATEPATLYRPVPDTQTSHAQSGRHGPRANTQTRLAHSRSKLDNAPH
ncbi:pro-neuregulin-2, membrane-bound isoform-like isoform X2 [Sinocyclocheilus grahami]|uniref:pro-neuregulin-2, membrane-bound isoform-like isoform X2 n=1 Tax=Sinocyclocheilus grahami TaxID=75366 RepID=UPI0007AD131F|nr:PREDICTED: pro-neuregulin-2, membrane-bound isoform-like isoform X2 [Sinocyclocheilus grahami]